MTYREYMSETMSISASAWAIFCSEEICGWRPKRNDMMAVVDGEVDWRLLGV